MAPNQETKKICYTSITVKSDIWQIRESGVSLLLAELSEMHKVNFVHAQGEVTK